MSDSFDSSIDTPQGNPTAVDMVLMLCWGAVVWGLGGLACGFAITKFGTLGAISLWLVGEAAGFGGRKLVAEKSKQFGLILVLACVGAFVVSEVCWLHWATKEGEEGWVAAIKLLPTFLQEYTLSALIGGIFCLIGANSAYRQVARRYRIVHIVED